MSNPVIHVDVTLLQFLADTGLPWIGALAARRFTDERVKSIIMTVLALAMGFLQDALASNGDIAVAGVLSKFATALIVGFITHQFIWKPVGVTGDRGIIQRVVPLGIGKPDPVYVAEHAEWVAERPLRRRNA